MSANNTIKLSPSFQFSNETTNLQRVQRIKLELINFTIQVQLYDGSNHHVSDLILVQDILRQASNLNAETKSRRRGGGDDNGGGVGGQADFGSAADLEHDVIVVDIELDPLNPAKAFHIPA